MTYFRLTRSASGYLSGIILGIVLLAANPFTSRTHSADSELAPVTINGDQLMVQDQPFTLRGINYIRPFGSSLSCPELHFAADPTCPWDIAAIAGDMDRLRDHGVNTVRIFLNYYAFGGARMANPDYDINTPLAHLDQFIAVANQRGIYVLPVLLAKYPQDRFGPDHYAATLDMHVRPVVSFLAGRPGILGWDLFNEPDIGSPIDQRCWDWDNGDFPLCLPLAVERMHFLQMLHYEVKWLDPEHPTTIGMGFAKSYFEPVESELKMAYLVDFYSFHYYDNDPFDSGRYAQHWYYGQGFPNDMRRAIDELTALNTNKPIVITEFGFPTGEGALRSHNDLRRDLRIGLEVVQETGASGVVLWPFQNDPEALIGDLWK